MQICSVAMTPLNSTSMHPASAQQPCMGAPEGRCSYLPFSMYPLLPNHKDEWGRKDHQQNLDIRSYPSLTLFSLNSQSPKHSAFFFFFLFPFPCLCYHIIPWLWPPTPVAWNTTHLTLLRHPTSRFHSHLLSVKLWSLSNLHLFFFFF